MRALTVLAAFFACSSAAFPQGQPAPADPRPLVATAPLVIQQPVAQTPKYLLGVGAKFGTAGMLVDTVQPSSPLLDMRIPTAPGNKYLIERNDLVVGVRNGLGQFIAPQSPESLAATLNTLPTPNTKLFIRDVNTGMSFVYDVRLLPNPAYQAGGGGNGNGGNGGGGEAKIVVVMIGDTDDKSVGEAVAHELKGLSATLAEKTQKKHLRGSPVLITGKDFTRERILQRINEVGVHPGDTLLCFVNCHGAHSPRLNDYSGGHFFSMPGGKVFPRAELRRALELKSAALTCLISDSCNKEARVPFQAYVTATFVERNLKFESLFLGPKGVVDFNSSSKGESAWTNNFAYFFSESLSMSTKSDLSPTDRTTWAEYTQDLSRTVQARYEAIRRAGLNSSTIKQDVKDSLRGQLRQTVEVYSLPR